MKRIDSIEDEMRGVVTYEVAGGRRVKLDRRAVQLHGAAAILRMAGIDPGESGVRLPVTQGGVAIGSLPAHFDPATVKPRTFMFEIRLSDFRRDGDVWVACPSLCPGDLEFIDGFVWDRTAKYGENEKRSPQPLASD